jgi:hypothetical protein
MTLGVYKKRAIITVVIFNKGTETCFILQSSIPQNNPFFLKKKRKKKKDRSINYKRLFN